MENRQNGVATGEIASSGNQSERLFLETNDSLKMQKEKEAELENEVTVEVEVVEPKTTSMLYTINESPPWYLALTLGFQQFLAMFGGTMTMPIILAPYLCLNNGLIVSEMIGTIFFVSGLVTIIQSTVGVRLPIIQGGTSTFLVAAFALFSSTAAPCHETGMMRNSTTGDTAVNASGDSLLLEQLNPGSDEEWKVRMREIQGGIILASFFEVFVGLFGGIGLLLRFIGPVTIATTIALVGLSLWEVAAANCAAHWPIAFLTICLIIVFSQFLQNVPVPVMTFVPRKKKCVVKWIQAFKLFPIALAILVAWFMCWILTTTDVLKNTEDSINQARTDINLEILYDSNWFRVPYPFQWGIPTVSAPSLLAMMTASLAGIIESIGDYYACARLAQAPTPPKHAVNRGIMVEGLGCVLGGLFGTGTGTTSYSANIAVIGVTKVASRRVIQYSGMIMMLFGVFAKCGALFAAMPKPIIGGFLMSLMGMISAVGMSNLQYTDLDSSRNLFVFGFSLFLGLALSNWTRENPSSMQTGNVIADRFIQVLCTTSMFVGGFVAVILDNLVPGTDRERGLHVWNEALKTEDVVEETDRCYRIPFVSTRLPNWKLWKYCPVSSRYGFRNTTRKYTADSESKTHYTSLNNM